MKVSLNTIKQLVNFELPSVDVLAAKINQQLGQVEEIVDLGEKYKDAVIVRVVSAKKHPNADKLSVCMVDDGGAVKDVDRNEDGYVQVVCGAPNVHDDMWAVWLPPNSTVPATYGGSEPFVLGARELRGVMSNGMLAAGDELAINSDHDGIIELTEHDLPPELDGRGLAAGQDFAELFGLDDTIIDIENKMFTHRPDCFGQLGVAREIAGIVGKKFTSPEWYLSEPEFAAATGLELSVFNDAPQNVPRFMAVAMNNVTIAPSPLWLQATLVRWGSKPINNVVDLTNYSMLLTAQPTHAYDYDKLAGHTLGARMAKPGESITLLNGKMYELTADDIVIADANGPVGLAGIMGGGESEVDATTKNIVLEVATFNMYTVRKTSMRYGLFTDALTRFNKGQSRLQNDRILARLMRGVGRYAGAKQASNISDLGTDDFKTSYAEQTVNKIFINDRLGADIPLSDMYTLLSNVEFLAHMSTSSDKNNCITAESITFTPPFWRTDIEQPEDIVEEIGRLYDLSKLPSLLPVRSIMPAPKNRSRMIKQYIRSELTRLGANEVLTYSFVNGQVLTRAGQNSKKAFKLGNALSPDLQYYRVSVLPSLLDKVHMNSKAGHDEFMLYEIGKGHHKDEQDEEGLPIEFEQIAGVYTRKKPKQSAPYFYVRQVVSQLGYRLCGRSATFVPLTGYDYAKQDAFKQMCAPFEPSRAAIVLVDGTPCGVVGELLQQTIAAFKLPEYTAAFELFLSMFTNTDNNALAAYVPLPKFPSISQDISIKSAVSVPYETVFKTIHAALQQNASKDIDVTVSPVSIYMPKNASDTKTTTLHMVFTHRQKTLKDADVAAIVEHAAIAAASEFGGQYV